MVITKEEKEENSRIYKIHNGICPTNLKIPGQIRVYREFIEDAVKEKLIRAGASDKEYKYLFYGTTGPSVNSLLGCILTPIIK